MLKTVKSVVRRCRRLGRVLRGRDLWRRREIDLPAERLGSEYGGWTIWPGLLDSRSIVYSFGVGQDISFDLGMISQFGCTIHAFDPTPRSIEWISRQTLPDEFRFHQYGLGHVDGLVSFAPPADPTHVSYSMRAAEGAPGKSECFPVRRLQTIAAELGHASIDVLKMDIEGAEFEALADLLRNGPRVDQLLVEFHHRFSRDTVVCARETLCRLREAGYLIFDVSSSGEEYSFVLEAALTPIPAPAYE